MSNDPPFVIDVLSTPGVFYPNDIAVDISFFPDHAMMAGIYDSMYDPFTENDRRRMIEQIRGFDFITDGKGNHYYLRMLSAIDTEATGYIEGRIRLLVLVHRMSMEEFRSIDDWEPVL